MGASVRAQTRALFAKSAIYQKRNTATNVCLVVAPIFFCVLLAALQLLANNLILSQRGNKCGCQCLECCIPMRVQLPWTPEEQQRIDAGETLRRRFVRSEECSVMDTGYCERVRNATCRSFNDSNCSLRFSAPTQAVFCPIPQPSTWPAAMQTPRRISRAGGTTTQWLPFTGSNMTAARLVAANMWEAPELPNLQALLEAFTASPLSLLNLRPAKILELILPVLAPGGLVQGGGESINLAQLSRLGLNFGSALRSNNDYYLENAFINSNSNNSQISLLLPNGFCNATGLYNVTGFENNQMPLLSMLLMYYNASYPAVVRPLLQLFNITADTLVANVGNSQLSSITAACVDILPREANSTDQLHRRLYCGFGSARCDGTVFYREYGGAWDFKQLGPTDLAYDAHYNLSLPADNGPETYRIPQLLHVATRAWTQTYWGDLPIVSRLRNRLLGVMSFPKSPTELKLDFSVLLGPLFYTWVIQMLMPSLLQQLVYEKEKRLRMMMKMHGLGDGAYWMVTYIWYLMLYCIYMVFFVVFGSAIRLKIFTTNSYSIQAVLYFIFGNNMIAFMFMLSSLFNSSRTATVVAFLYIFASGLIGELLLRTLMHKQPAFIIAVQLVPGFALYRGLYEFSEYSIRALFSNVSGLTWANLSDPGNGMYGAWIILAAEWPVFMALGYYFEQVLSNGTGMRRHPLFFIRWMWRKEGQDNLDAMRAGGMSPSHTVGVGRPASPEPHNGSLELTPFSNGNGNGSGVATSKGDGGGNGGTMAVYGNGSQQAGGGGPVAEAVDDGVGGGGGSANDGPGGGDVAAAESSCGVGAAGGSAVVADTASGGSRPGTSGSGGRPGAVTLGGTIAIPSRPGSGVNAGGAGGAASATIIAVGTTASSASGASHRSDSPAPTSPVGCDAPPDRASASASVSSASVSRGDARIVVRPASPATEKAAAVGLNTGVGSEAGTPSGPVVARGNGNNGGGGIVKGGGAGVVIDAVDVAAEADRVANMSEESLAATPIVVRGLSKVFASDRAGAAGGGHGWWAACCGEVPGRAAVRGLTLAIERGECFGLLGPNGAGKTTTINMLTGFLEPSAGDALVEGRSVRSRMPEIYRMMGVCPQENLLWEQLTGEEHLLFYGRLKGLTGKALTAAVDVAVRSVKLHINNAGRRRVGAYSGGMKRRLSVAISFIGSPQVVYLDEPSTGLDPASRRGLWDVVRQHKEGRGIILTTHSMEEAEILCDRLGIFVDGQLVCIGNPREITSRYAGYFVFTITVGHGHEDAAQAFVMHMSPNARLTYALGTTFKYELPTADVTLSAVFEAMAVAKGQMQVLDWGVANATLEEVFIKFARAIGAETSEGH